MINRDGACISLWQDSVGKFLPSMNPKENVPVAEIDNYLTTS